MVKSDDYALVIRERVNGCLHYLGPFLTFHYFGRQRAIVLYLSGYGVLIELYELVERSLPMRFRLLSLVKIDVGNDAVYPGEEVGVSSEGLNGVEDADECFLAYITGVVIVAGYVECAVEDPLLVAREELVERADVAILAAQNESALGGTLRLSFRACSGGLEDQLQIPSRPSDSSALL